MPPAKKKHCLLVVDDEPDVRDSVFDLLRREFRVLKAASVEEAYRLMEQEEIHIIMTDQRMPHATGVEFLAKARVSNPRAVRMLFTGYADLDAIIAAINQGHVFGFLKKPWQPEELLEAVHQAADEYDWIERSLDESERLKREVESLQRRVDLLEAEVRRLGGLTSTPASTD
jgi:response regulator RpfG family c-di-GMP phosphodiesterase